VKFKVNMKCKEMYDRLLAGVYVKDGFRVIDPGKGFAQKHFQISYFMMAFGFRQVSRTRSSMPLLVAASEAGGFLRF
jgi:hypothetical protein